MTGDEATKAWMLLQVAEAALKFPQLKFLHDRALADLEAMGAEPEPEEPELPMQRRA